MKYLSITIATSWLLLSTSLSAQSSNNKNTNIISSWSNTEIRHTPTYIDHPPLNKKWETSAWKGERIHNQFIIQAKEKPENIVIIVTELTKRNGEKIDSSRITAGFEYAVLTDGLSKNNTGCGLSPLLTDRDSSWVYDRISFSKQRTIYPDTLYPVWVSIGIPQQVNPGIYQGKVVLSSETGYKQELNITLNVSGRNLSEAKDWDFHLDLWQNPYAVARYYDLYPWSDEHLEAMRPCMKQLAEAGQKVITTTLLHKPWGEQTYDYYETMVLRSKKIDGSWIFNYDIFDRWVSFMMSLGINEQINCYTIAPWEETYQYFDESTNTHQYIKAKIGDPDYMAYWNDFLQSFNMHLKQKGWFDKVTIAIDEQPLEIMQQVIHFIKTINPEFRISLAGEYHPEIESEIYDYCIAFHGDFPQDVKERRKKEGKKTTFYTCCTEALPNTFTFSPPSESAWLGWYAASTHYDGYLRWAYNCWNKEPMSDSRFSTFSAGDCFLLYPKSWSSIRMEKLREGIQAFEKIKILQIEYQNNPKKLELIHTTLKPFADKENLYKLGAAQMIKDAHEKLKKIGF